MADQGDVFALIARARSIRDGGDADGATAILRAAYDEVVADDDHFLATALSHDLGHAVRDPEQQLHWHTACLGHIEAVGDDRVRGFSPSAHANLGLTLLQLGRVAAAREHCDLGEQASPALADDDYGRTIRAGLARLRREIAVSAEGERRDDLNPWNGKGPAG